MKRILTGITGAVMVLGTFVPVAFASSSSYRVGGRKAISVGGQVESNPYTLVAKDAGNMTSYMGVWYLGQAIQDAGGDYSWDGATKTFSITTPGINTMQFNIPGGVGSGDTTLIVNGVIVKRFNSFAAQDPAGGSSETTFMPLYYLGEVFSQLSGASWDGNTFDFNDFVSYQITGNYNLAVGQKEVLFLNENNMAVSGTSWSVDGNGAATIDSYGNFSAVEPGTYIVTASYNGNTATAKVVVCGSVAGVTLAATSPTVVANNVSTDTVTMKVVDASGNVIPNFNGYATITNTSGGYNAAVTFYDPTTGERVYGNTLSNVLITNGTGTFAVQANSTSNVSDTFTVSNVYSAYGTSEVGQVNSNSWSYGTASITAMPQVATSIKVKADRNVVNTAVGGQTDNVYAEVDDQTGNPMVSGSYPITFAVTGSAAKFYGQTTYTSTGWGYVGGFSNAEATLYSIQGASGELAVTASSGSLSGSLNLMTTGS